ncbi:hypothetical protein [Sphingomonas glaciei]|uniref:Uncharacterized protein n=1 Tax=Sphingomonas glaciei TaxID=2938948 RepID=A0ABY5MYQ5_9SPHN|nr:hypothetical protein [Sphingomonas glaciei]UUR08223.1 hypothetical protein M1K48_00815 [Sphingomonas glaciei]
MALPLPLVEERAQLSLYAQSAKVRVNVAVAFAREPLTKLFQRAAFRCHFQGALDGILHSAPTKQTALLYTGCIVQPRSRQRGRETLPAHARLRSTAAVGDHESKWPGDQAGPFNDNGQL